MTALFKVPTAVERAVERALVVAAVAGLTYTLGLFDTKTAAGLAGYFGIKTVIDYVNQQVPNNSAALSTAIVVPTGK